MGYNPVDEYDFSYKIARKIYLKEIEETYDLYLIIGIIYQVGKIEGIRKERAKRKTKLSKSNDNKQLDRW